MKIIHLINLEKMGGAEKVFLQYIQESNAENVIFCISNFADKDIQETLKGHKIHFINRAFSFSEIKYPSFLRKFILQNRIESQSADVLMVWDIIPRLYSKPKGIKTVYYDHGSSWRFHDSDKTRAFFNHIDGAIAASHASKVMMQERFSINVQTEIINNKLPDIESTMMEKTCPSKDHLILGVACRLVAIKAIGVAILTVYQLLKMGINARLLIAGSGPNEAALKTLVEKYGLEDNVIFLGYQSKLDHFYDQIHLYMSTSITENYSLSCLDALLHNVPCLFSMVDGQPEVNRDGITGIGIVPTLTMELYESQSGYSVNVPRETPYFVYNPIEAKLTKPLVLSYLDCANAISDMLLKDRYADFQKGIEDYKIMLKYKENMAVSIDRFVTGMVK